MNCGKELFMQKVSLTLAALLVFGAGLAVGAFLAPQDMSLSGQVYESPGGTRIRMLLEEANLGGNEVEIGEITFPPGVNSGEHLHGATEIFYVLSGELEHVVDGKSHLLKPGMLGFVRPPAKVNHIVPGKEPTKALVIWAPGGEAHRIVDRWKKIQ
jgi:quercetin dioxygenase-like cupin family protein